MVFGTKVLIPISFRQHSQSIIAVAYAKSIINLSQVPFNTFRQYFQLLVNERFKGQNLITIELAKKTRELYNALSGNEKSRLAVDGQQDLEIESSIQPISLIQPISI